MASIDTIIYNGEQVTTYADTTTPEVTVAFISDSNLLIAE